MSKRVGLTLPDEFYAWLAERASDTGLSVSTYVLMTLTQHKKNLENQLEISSMMKVLAKLPPELIQAEMKHFANENEKGSEKQ